MPEFRQLPIDTADPVPSVPNGPATRARSAGPAAPINVEQRLWATADELRANSKLKSSEYSVPVLGLIFLRLARRLL